MPGKQKIKDIQSLGQKKHRDELGLFIAEGPKIVAELIQYSPQQVEEIYAVKDWIKSVVISLDIKVHEVTASELGKISQLKTANLVVAVIKKFPEESKPVINGKVSLVLDTIQDPGNMGTIIRIADWFGIENIICSNDSADIYNPKVVQSTMGSIVRVKVHYTDLENWLPQQQLRIYAAMTEGKDITKMSSLNEGLIIIGNESKGISKNILDFVNEKITIPGKGKAESLNAAVATGIILSHLTT